MRWTQSCALGQGVCRDPRSGPPGMRRIAVAVVVVLLSIECHAQSGPSAGQCEQVRSAVAQYGLQNARKHAMANYGLSLADLRNIEQNCGIGERSRGRSAKRPRADGL